MRQPEPAGAVRGATVKADTLEPRRRANGGPRESPPWLSGPVLGGPRGVIPRKVEKMGIFWVPFNVDSDGAFRGTFPEARYNPTALFYLSRA